MATNKVQQKVTNSKDSNIYQQSFSNIFPTNLPLFFSLLTSENTNTQKTNKQNLTAISQFDLFAIFWSGKAGGSIVIKKNNMKIHFNVCVSVVNCTK